VSDYKERDYTRVSDPDYLQVPDCVPNNASGAILLASEPPGLFKIVSRESLQ
jgi:hypothetical protein